MRNSKYYPQEHIEGQRGTGCRKISWMDDIITQWTDIYSDYSVSQQGNVFQSDRQRPGDQT